MNTPGLIKLLKAKYAPPAYAFLTEVGNGTGSNCRRHVDGLAMSIWPSRSLELEGFEVKSSRSDWQKELGNPAKAEEIYKFCDRWWLVAGDDKIVRPGELPPTWGLMVAAGDKLKVATPAAKLEPLQVSRSFMAAIFRRAVEQSVDEVTIRNAKVGEYNRGFEDGKKSCESCLKYERKRHDELATKVREFEEASGLNIAHGWERPQKIGEAVKRVLNEKHPVDELRRMLVWISEVQRSGEAMLKEIGVVPCPPEST